MEVNGKFYPLWGQFVERQQEWIGGVLEDSGDNMDRSFGAGTMQTKITGITLEPTGENSAFFSVVGEEFTCGFNVKYGGVSSGKEGWITFSGYGGHIWRIKKL